MMSKKETRLVAVFLPCWLGSRCTILTFGAMCFSRIASIMERKMGRLEIGRKFEGSLGRLDFQDGSDFHCKPFFWDGIAY